MVRRVTLFTTAATLNAGDSLTGTALIGSGTFNVGQLASFTGFESIRTDNATNSFANLTLGSQPIEVDVTGYLGIQVNSPSNWNGSDIIKSPVTTGMPAIRAYVAEYLGDIHRRKGYAGD